MNKDKKFYEMIIRDAKILIPLITTTTFLCKHRKTSKWLKKVIQKVTAKNHIILLWKPYNFTTIPRDNANYGYESFKSDRIFLLKEIIRYCDYKLKQLK